MAAKKFTLGRNERLKSRKSIEQLFSKGRSISFPPFRVFYEPTTAELRFGVGVSAKQFKKAVDRNRIKRLTREAWRLQKIPLQEKLKSGNRGMIVFFTYGGKELPGYKTVYDATRLIVNKLLKIIDENGTPDS